MTKAECNRAVFGCTNWALELAFWNFPSRLLLFGCSRIRAWKRWAIPSPIRSPRPPYLLGNERTPSSLSLARPREFLPSPPVFLLPALPLLPSSSSPPPSPPVFVLPPSLLSSPSLPSPGRRPSCPQTLDWWEITVAEGNMVAGARVVADGERWR